MQTDRLDSTNQQLKRMQPSGRKLFDLMVAKTPASVKKPSGFVVQFPAKERLSLRRFSATI